ncbi:unnamed protein product [Urochloa humidicola]
MAATRHLSTDQVEEQEGDNEDSFDKACWTVEHNTHVFRELALDQIRKGNCPNLQMKSYAVKAIQEQFYELIGLRLDDKQLRNRFNQCKAMYNWLKKHRKDTGQGVNVHGGIDGHDDEWWKLNCQGTNQSEYKKFRWGMPSYVKMLYDMFDGTQVDGSTSCIPGSGDWGPPNANAVVDGGEDQEADDDEEQEEPFRSPMTTDSKKRTSSTTDTASSPNSKKSKSPMVRCMDNLIHTLEVGSSKEVLVAKEIQQHIVDIKKEHKLMEEQRRKAEIAECLTAVRACGVEEDTDEFYVATILFQQQDNRTVFGQMTTVAGRIGWLKRSVRHFGEFSG